MNKLCKAFALLLLASPAFAVRIAAPGRVVPQAGVVGAAGAALAAPQSMLVPTLGNSIRSANSLSTLNTPPLSLTIPAAAAAQNNFLGAAASERFRASGTAAQNNFLGAAASERFRASGMHQAAAMRTEMAAVEKSGNTSAAPVFRKIFDNDRSAAPSYTASVLAGTGAAIKNPPGRLLHNERTFRPDRVPSPEGESPQRSDWKKSGWWKAAKAVAAVGGGLFLGSKAADFAYAFALAPAGVYGLVGLALAGGLAAWGLRKLSNARGPQTFYSVLLGALMFNAGGNLIADVFGIGLMSFAIASPIALAALLWAAGVGLKRG